MQLPIIGITINDPTPQYTTEWMLIETAGEYLASYVIDLEENIFVFLTDPQTIQICRVVLDKRLLKKNEGGGFHDVPVIEVLLRLTKKA